MKQILIALVIGIVSGLVGSAATAQVLTVSFGMDNAPYSIPASSEGITYDVLRQTLGRAGYQIEPVYAPYEPRFKVYQEKKLDVVMADRGLAHRRGIRHVVNHQGDVIVRMNMVSVPLEDDKARALALLPKLRKLKVGQAWDWPA